MKQYTVKWSGPAKADIHNILDYIKRTQSHERARYVRLGIQDAVRATVDMPTKHRIEPTLERTDIRYILKWRFKILFQITDECIVVLRVFHTSQNPDKLTI